MVPGEICRIGLNLILTMDLVADSRESLTDSIKLNKADSARYSYWCMMSNDLPNSSHYIRK